MPVKGVSWKSCLAWAAPVGVLQVQSGAGSDRGWGLHGILVGIHGMCDNMTMCRCPRRQQLLVFVATSEAFHGRR
jgi:hypothetical protein